MNIRSSLKRKSILALAVYLCFFITTIGTISYLVVEPPVRAKLQNNLDLRTELLASQIQERLNRSVGVVQSLVSIGATDIPQKEQDVILFSLFSVLDGITVSGGLWPEPIRVDGTNKYTSLFYNRAADGKIDRIYSWNNPESGGYNEEDWYSSAARQPIGTVAWSEVYIDAYTHIQMITASSPYYVDGRFAGVATVDLSLEELIRFVSQQAEEANLGVVLRDGYGEFITEYNFNLVENIYISELSFGKFNWSVDVVNTKLLVSEEVYDLVSSVELGIIPILLICVMGGYYLISRYLIHPIVVIAKKLDASKEGGIIDMTYHSNDEIRRLIDSFNMKTVFLEEEKVKAQASTRAKSAFLATLSHEVRTPMNGVLGTAQILLKSDITEEQRKHLKSLYDSGDHMMTLLNEILDFSKIEQGHLELDSSSFPLDSIIGSINSVYHTLSTEKGLQFKVYSKVPSGRWYNSDKARLRQVLFNLLNNAVKFTSRGFVEVYLEEITQDGKNYLSIRIRDTGIGISKEAQQRIFNPFEQAESSTTRRFGGTGLGLAIVKQICELMEGEITVTSELGIGTSFDVLIHMEVCEPGQVEVQAHHKLDCSGLNALIVEDNRTNTIIIETFMRNKGFQCTSVENGELAVHEMVNGNYDLVLMDNHMPVMDGVEATTAIRALPSEKKRTVIFGCTADVFRETRERMLGAGVDYIIAKPIDESELDDALYRFSERIFQFQENKEPSNIPLSNYEEMLVNLYMCSENEQFEKGLAIVTALLSSTHEAGLIEVLGNIKKQFENQHSANSADLDLLTVLLAK